jgi:hypothetical protein
MDGVWKESLASSKSILLCQSFMWWHLGRSHGAVISVCVGCEISFFGYTQHGVFVDLLIIYARFNGLVTFVFLISHHTLNLLKINIYTTIYVFVKLHTLDTSTNIFKDMNL